MARESRNWPSLRCPVCEVEFRPYKHSHRRMCCSDACRRIHEEAKYVVKRTLNVAEAAYLAGLIDGEGTISLWKVNAPKNARGFTHHVTFTIAQSNEPYLDEIRNMIGNGTVKLKNPGGDRGKNSKPCFGLRFNAYQTRWILPQILPYLRLKRRQAEIVLEYFRSLHVGGRRGPSEAHLELMEECQRLNRRGLVQ